jgi:hypothetical protein
VCLTRDHGELSPNDSIVEEATLTVIKFNKGSHKNLIFIEYC